MPRIAQVVALVVALVVCAGVTGVWLIVQNGRANAIAGQVASFPVSSSPSVAPITVTVISDDLATPASSGTPVTEWPLLVQRALRVDVVSLSSAGSGYTTRPLTAQFGGTFRARSTEVAPSSRIVMIVGGANDQRATSAALVAAATETISNIRHAAPDATIVVVGPASTSSDPPASLIGVRDTVQLVARLNKVEFVDPLAQHWLSGIKGVLAADGTSLTEKGERTVATRIEGIIEPLLQQ